MFDSKRSQGKINLSILILCSVAFSSAYDSKETVYNLEVISKFNTGLSDVKTSILKTIHPPNRGLIRRGMEILSNKLRAVGDKDTRESKSVPEQVTNLRLFENLEQIRFSEPLVGESDQ